MGQELQNTQQQLEKPKKTLADVTLERVTELRSQGAIDIPENYSPGNALKSAWLILQETLNKEKRPVLESCTKESIANALLYMVVSGLNPSKKQCYFIAYGKQLSCDKSYFGDMSETRRVHGDIPDDGFAYGVVYQGDDFSYEIIRGKYRVVKHVQKLENRDKNKIKASYCEVYDGNGTLISSVMMTFDEIKQSWKQSKMHPVSDKGQIKPDSTHAKFTEAMCLRTVIRKACKPIINSSNDKNLNLLKKIVPSTAQLQAEEEIAENANAQEISFTDISGNGEDNGVPEGVDPQTGEVIGADKANDEPGY